MFTQNAFATASPLLPGGFLQWFLVVMIVAVIAGTIFDMIHKGSARYFFANMRRAKVKAKPQRELGGGDLVGIAVQTAVVDVMTSGEFCNPRRRVAHLLTMYGFVIYVVTTAIMVFGYGTAATPAIVPVLWWIGGLMVLAGGYWFWFFIRVDVAAEGNSPLRFVRADLFIVSMLVSITLGLVWAATGGGAGVALLALPPRHGGPLPRGAVVEVRAHVLQAGGGVRETGIEGRWHRREPADADPGRSRTTEAALHGTVAGRSDGHGTRHQARRAPPLLENSQHSRSRLMPTFVYMTRCDGCGHCVDICPSDIMHIDPTYRRAYNIEPNMCWECYSCVKACPQHAIDVRGYADFAPLGHSVRVDRDERKGTIAWRIKFRDGTEKNFLSPITTKPWGTAIPKLADVPAPSKEMRGGELLYSEPKYIRMDEGGLRTLKDAGLKLKKGVYY